MRPLTPGDPLDCEQVVRALWDYIDRRAEAWTLAAIEDHLARCDGCRAHAEFEQRLVTALSGLRTQHSDPKRLREDVMKMLKAAGLGAEEGDASSGEPT